MADPVVIATWSFGKIAVEAAWKILTNGGAALDAALAGAQAVEDDPKVNSVGYGGLGDSNGTVTLDACVMDGRTLNCGGVAAVENIRHVAALAKRVMEQTPHVLLVGNGARTFGVQNGFPLEPLSTPESWAEWEKRRPAGQKAAAPRPKEAAFGELAEHDTVTVLALDKAGHLGGVCTTSGLPHKRPGRVGDSPLIGAGLYVDDQAGAAGATGVGEEIIRVGGSVLLVEAMRAGSDPQTVCEKAIQRVNALAARRGVHPAGVAFLALDPKGRVGAACTERTGFVYAIARGGQIDTVTAKEVRPHQ